jgi:2-polyprenyl-3-methyl-5-hydroxy-6-metoxy-1,4-benzoquinol methylase
MLNGTHAERLVIEEGCEERLVADAVGSGLRVLDGGCGRGRVARALADLGCSVDAIELSSDAIREARSACGAVVEGSLTDPEAWRALGDRRYDAIVFCHVLEHLTDPRAAIDLACARLAPGGRLVVALPNVATWRTRLHLLRGRWDYTDEGILDRTHVKFYTLKTARELLEGANLRLLSAKLMQGPPSGNVLRRAIVRGVRTMSRLATAPAFLFVAEPSGSRVAPPSESARSTP